MNVNVISDSAYAAGLLRQRAEGGAVPPPRVARGGGEGVPAPAAPEPLAPTYDFRGRVAGASPGRDPGAGGAAPDEAPPSPGRLDVYA